MRICMLTTRHSPLDDRIFYKEAVSLKRVSSEIKIIAPYCRSRQIVNGIEIWGLPPEAKSQCFLWSNLYQKALRAKADVYHCHEPDSLLVGILVKNRQKAKLIYDCHEYHPEIFARRFPEKLQPFVGVVAYWAERLLCKKADYVITVCQELAEKFRRWGNRVQLVENYAIRWPDKGFSLSISRTDLGIRPEESVGVFVGGMYRERGIYQMMDAIRILRGWGRKVKLLLVGPGVKGFLESAKAYAQAKGIAQGVVFTGKVAFTEIPSYLAMADFGLVMDYPERRKLNTVAVKVFEYMQAGLPIVASDLPANRRIIQTEQCGVLTDPLRPEKIAEAVALVLKKPDLGPKMGRRGREAFLRKYNWDQAEKRLLAVYRDL
ncbi:MAG: hypothetical protein B1H40_03525 [Candidatus Latescibacteria bacterium 4484_181]|nr:MAG: hypothetical protein B1H40_03525 [Candidatus Latescibacteria bacterium 4484_181]RKY69163.1 MAG: hypothetical protein DRQ02_01990 [Candidatus Latescibacterota bacterium]RKY73413.1 MAG: hypothetical protein DRQ24_02430 [Candidatus Latescibacterota bacterium]